MKIPKGFLLSGINCGIKKKNLDLGLIYTPDFSKAASFFTSNVNPSYSVVLSKKNSLKPVKAVLVNSGNANCYSHKSGLKDTNEIVVKLAKVLKAKKENILICSTGIIGRKLPKAKVIKNLPVLVRNLGKNSGNFAKSIITTDTFTKISSATIKLDNLEANILGFAKGAGMIYPNMATMLGFILTDLDVPANIFKSIAKEAVEESFNSISVDGCMSTNDTVIFMTSKKVPLKSKKQLKLFSQKLKEVCLNLAKLIIKDAEGATKFIQIKTVGAETKAQAKKAAFSLANSNLFKCALHGENANWGRIVSALGQVGVKVSQNLGVKASSLKAKTINIVIDLKKGNATATVYTCDLGPKYIKINAEYN